MPAPIGIQLYSLRDALAQDFEGNIRSLADKGFVSVEPFGGLFEHNTPEKAGALFKSLGLQVSSAHSALPLGDDKNKVLDTMAAIACSHLICPFIPPDEFTSADKIKAVCEHLNEAYAVTQANNLRFSYHNHWWEYATVEGRPAYQIMLDHLDPGILLEIDTYWVKTGGVDPVEVVKSLGERAPLLHIKDGPATTDEPMVAAGEGIMDFPAIIAAGGGATEWLIVELDRCATDMLEAVKKSYDYLVGKGLARGNKN